MAVETTWVAFGAPALDALEGALADALVAAPLGPVTVVTPSPSVAVTTRRAVARRRGGLVGVGFHSLGAVAEMIAAPRLADAGVEVGVDRELVVAGVRSVLASEPGRLKPIRHHRATWEAVAATIAELDSLDAGARAVVAGTGDLPSEMARLHGRVTDLIGSVGSMAVFRLAAETVRAGSGGLGDVGPVIVHLPATLSRCEVDLLSALGERLPVRLLLGTAGRPDDDARVAETLVPLRVEPPSAPVERPVATAVVSANDIDDEVRAVVRRLLHHADAGTDLHRMALVHPRGAPYSRVVSDVLTGAGIPFSGPSTGTLAQSATGRVLTGLMGVITSRFARQDVVDLWATGVVVDADGRIVPSAAFDDQSRRLGVIRGIDAWWRSLDTSDDRIRARRDDAEGAGRDLEPSDLDAWIADQLEANERLRAALAALDDLAQRAPDRWGDVADWCADVIDRLCGAATRRSSWPDREIEADTAIRTAVGRLVALERVEAEPGRDVVFDTVRTVLDAPSPRRSRTGTGLLVTTIDRPPVVPLDVVAVVGLVEGQAPHVGGDDVLLGEGLRSTLDLPGAVDRQRDERRAFDATVASSSVRLLSFARHDQRSGRTMVPSRWIVDAIEAVSGTRPDAEVLMSGHDVDGVDIVHSYSAGLSSVADGATAALHAGEKAFASMAATGSLSGHPALADPILAAGATLLRARWSDRFTRFDGNLGGDGVDVSGEAAVLSPTSLETYASCPRRWFFAHALRLRTVERPEEIDRLQAHEKGTLVHLVLERFFGEMIDAESVPRPGAPWEAAETDRLFEIAAEECEALEARGLTGHPRWWEHDRAEIAIALRRTLGRDVEVRAHLGTMPIRVEFGFGRRGAPPLQVDLGDGRTIALAGSADRVDLGDGVVTIWDYKYSASKYFHDLVKDEDKGGDPLLAGTKLQLVAYGMAAQEAHPMPEVHAAYWFLRPDTERPTVGYPVGEELRDRFRRVLGVLADGIEEGRFPARPGEYQWHRGTHSHCAWCDFDDICPRDRDEEWERVRLDPSLHRVARLADEGSASVLDDPALDGPALDGPATEVRP